MKIDPYAHPPFLCVLCGDEIGARRPHIVLTAISAMKRTTAEEREAATGPIVCHRCLDRQESHDATYPECKVAGCDLYDHTFMYGADRAAAVAWLVAHGLTETPDQSEGK